MPEFQPSTYQQAIYDFFQNGVGNAVINAKAGSGKTTTAVKALSYIPDNKRVLFVAFNRDIVTEIKERIGDKRNITVATYHSMGKRIVEECLPAVPQLDNFKYKTYLTQNLQDIAGDGLIGLKKTDIRDYLKNILRLMDLCRVNCCQCEREINDVILKYGVDTISNEVEVVWKLCEWGKKKLDIIDYTDMIWFPYELGMKTKKWLYDWVIVDEAQDSSPVQQELFKSCIKKGGRFCCIGDVDQTINAWCGGDRDAFNNILRMPNVTRFELPICYRCPKSVVRLAQSIVPDIQYAPNAIEGEIVRNANPYMCGYGDMILCRNTTPLSKLYIKFLQHGKTSYIRGSDIGANLNQLISSMGVENLASNFTEYGLIPALYSHLLRCLDKICTKHKLTREMAVQTTEFMDQYDSVKAIEILSEGCTDVAMLQNRISEIFSDRNDKTGVCLTTIHKAKGSEADNVYILCPSLMPSKQAKEDWEITAEKNLIYVAYTRAKKTLNFISEEYFPPQMAYGASDDVEVIMSNAEGKLKGLGITGDTGYNATMLVKKKSSTVQPVRKTVPLSNAPKKVGAKKFKKFL